MSTDRFALPPDPVLRAWLQAPGSLTARLRCFGQLELRVLRQGQLGLWPVEQADLRQRGGYVREVVLLLDGRPAVWARSATSLAAIKGPWRAMQGLGSRPLAELLFAASHVERTPLRAQQLPRSGLMQRHLRQQWLALQYQPQAAGIPRWARSSVFRHKGHALRVMEAFSPWLCTLQQSPDCLKAQRK